MAKTKEELNQIKDDLNDLKTKLNELSDDELESIASGEDLDGIYDFLKKIGKGIKSITKPVIK